MHCLERLRRTVRPVACATVALSAAAPVTHAGETGESGKTDRIVVTATRRAAPLDKLIGNTSRLEAEDIDLIAADHVSEALNRLPGINLQRGNGQEHLTAIRSPVLTGGAGAGSFLYLEDGVPLRAAGFANVNGLFEAHTEIAGAMEVVRGPGSVLYGSNAVHGLINVVTRAPADEFEALLEGEGGSFGRYQGRAFVSGHWGAHGLFAGISLLHEDGWRFDSGLDQQKATLRWDYAAGPFSVSTVAAAVNLNQETAGFVRGPGAYRNSAQSRINPNPDAFRDARAVRLSSRMEYRLTDEWLVSLTPFARWTDMTFRLHFLPSQALEDNGHWSAGLLATVYWSPAPDWTVIGGIDVEGSDGFLREEQELPDIGSFVQGVHYDYEIFATVLAPYLRGEWRMTPRLRLEGGVRLEYATYAYDNLTGDGLFGRFLRPEDRGDNFVTVTPKIGAGYDLSADHSVYLRYARGARAPQTTDLYRLQENQTTDPAKPEEIDSVELGLRGRAGRAFFYDLAAYYMAKRNFFFRDADGFNVPDGRTRHVGVEVTGSVPLGRTLKFQAAATYARHTYAFDRIVGPASETIRSGNDVDTAPHFLVNARLVWRPLANLTAEAELIHVDEYFMDAANTVSYPGHRLVNLRLAWDVTRTVGVFASVRNLTNTDYAERADFAFGSERYFPGEDRAFAAGLRVRLGAPSQ